MFRKVNLPADHYLERMINNQPFSMVRFGDGEILTMFNPEIFKTREVGSWIFNCGDRVAQIIINKRVTYLCFLDGTFWEHGPHKEVTEKFIDFLVKLTGEDVNCFDFYNGEVWQDLSFAENGSKIEMLMAAIFSQGKPVFIGGSHLAHIPWIHGASDIRHISVHYVNAYDSYDRILSLIIESFNEGHRMFCFSCGIVGKVLIDDLSQVIGDRAFLIDFGSVFDPYCGLLSRDTMVQKGFEYFQKYTSHKLT